jgi:hypothetical protein
MPVFESKSIFENNNWIDNNLILELGNEAQIRMFGLDFFGEKRTDNFDDNFEAFHKQKFERILKSDLEVNVNIVLKDTLIDIPISQFSNNFYQKNEKLFYHSIIEGSNDCGLKLIINKFNRSILKNNLIKNVISFQIKNENQINDIDAFWKLLYYELTTNGFRKNITSLEKYISECLDIILGQMYNSSDVFLIFDEVNKDLHNSIINSFWTKLIEEFEKNAGTQYAGKLYVFSINNSFSNETHKLSIFNTVSKSFEPINYSPLNPLTEEEFKTKWPNLFLFPKLSNMQYNDILEGGQPPKRLKAIKEICNKADEKDLYTEIYKMLNN